VGLIDEAAGLLFDGVCPGCGVPGRGLCRACRAAIAAGAVTPHTRTGLTLPLWAAGDYVPPLPRVISQAKDHHRWQTIPVLGQRLAYAVGGLIDAAGLTGPGLLVPFPSRPATVRERGLDVTAALAETAARRLRAVGVNVSVAGLLVHHRAVKDQGGLSDAARRRNLAGALVARRPPPGHWLVLVDDVVTTGASLGEGVRALTARGYPPAGLATVAATLLRTSQSVPASTFS